jgi:hypothetical protein
MSDVPGPPVSPHGDPEQREPRAPSEPSGPDGSDTDSEGGSASWYLPALEQTDFPGRRGDYGRATSSYARRQADGAEAPRGDTLPLGAEAPVVDPLVHDPLTAIRDLTRNGPTTMKIGIWGSPASGKSTLLAALQHATGHADRSLGRWNLYPLTEESKELLVIWNQRLVTDRKFPEATRIAAEVELRWRFRGDLAGSKYQPPWQRLRRVPESSNFDLDLIDVNGEVFGPGPTDKEVPVEIVTRTLDHLANARGLIYLFDPITEREIPTVARYMHRPLAELLTLVESRRRTIGGRLPHYLSVCVTKFDDPQLFQQACRAGFVNTGRDGRPRVLDKHAKRFFDALCEGKFWEEPDERGTNGPRFVRDMLRQYFHPARTRYYVTSSIGFNLGADGQFDPSRYSMVREEEEEEGLRIIGPIEPINVLEPLVDLHMELRRRA